MTLDVAGLVEHVMKAWLLLYLCQDSIALREKYRSIGKILFFLTDISCRILDFGVGLGQQNTLWQ